MASVCIPFAPIFEFFICPICYESITDCYMTPCGHNFCEACIHEAINRKHRCPMCSVEVMAEQLVKNHHMDGLMQAVMQQKEIASKNYVLSVMSAQVKNSDHVSPIEAVFQKYSSSVLMMYSEHFQELKNKMEIKISDLNSHYQSRCSELHAKVNNRPSSNSDGMPILDLVRTCSQQNAFEELNVLK